MLFHRSKSPENITHLLTSHCNSEKLQLPTASSASSMRRSQSAVEATADYLGTRVARLSYLNPDEANRNIFIYRVPKRWTIKVIQTSREAEMRPRCVCMLFCVSLVWRDTYGLKGGDCKARQKMCRMPRSARYIGIWMVKFWQCVCGEGVGEVSYYTGCWLCCFGDLGSAALGGENTD